MSHSSLAEIAATNRWIAIYPEVTLGLIALALLLADLFVPARRRALLPGLAMAAQLAVLAALGTDLLFVGTLEGFRGEVTFGGMLRHSEAGDFFRVLLLASSLLVSWLATVSLDRLRVPPAEFHHVLIVATAALLLLSQSNHFVSLFVSLETVTVCLYVLVSCVRHNPLTLEAGLKYLVLGALSSALLLFGVVLLYGVAGTPGLSGRTGEPMNFLELGEFIALHRGHPVVLAGASLVLAGVAFKVGSFPFHIWIPEVYQGAPLAVTAFLAVSSKVAGFAMLAVLVFGPFAPLSGFFAPILAVAAAGSILWGNLAALGERNLKRLLGLSGISHAGFLLLGMAAALRPDAPSWTFGAVQFYLAIYAISSLAVFGVMVHLAGEDDTRHPVEAYEDLARRQPLLAGVLAVGVGSLAGIPPLAGFIGKALLFVAAYQAGLAWLVAVGILGVVVSIGYYFVWLRTAIFEVWRIPGPDADAAAAPFVSPTFAARAALLLLTVAVILLGFFQGYLGTALLGG